MAGILLAGTTRPADRIDTSWRLVTASINLVATRRLQVAPGFLASVPYAKTFITAQWAQVDSLFGRWSSRENATSIDADQYGVDASAAVAALALA